MNPPGCICRYEHKSDPMCTYVAPPKQVDWTPHCRNQVCDLAATTGITCPDDECDLDTGLRSHPPQGAPTDGSHG